MIRKPDQSWSGTKSLNFIRCTPPNFPNHHFQLQFATYPKAMGRFQEWWSVITAFFSLGGTVVDEIPSNLTFVKSSVIITGATSGLGLEAAILYVQLGASPVIITARTATRGLEAKSTIEQRTGKKDVVQVRILDMDTFDGVKSFVNGLRKDVKSIDIVLLNAGLHNFNYQKLPEGWEGDLQVNVLSTALLGY